MTPFTFAVMLLTQRTDEALRLERQKTRPNTHLLTLLRRQKRRLGSRLSRSLAAAVPAGS